MSLLLAPAWAPLPKGAQALTLGHLSKAQLQGRALVTLFRQDELFPRLFTHRRLLICFLSAPSPRANLPWETP